MPTPLRAPLAPREEPGRGKQLVSRTSIPALQALQGDRDTAGFSCGRPREQQHRARLARHQRLEVEGSVSCLGGLVLRGPQDRPLLPAPPPPPCLTGL